MRLRWLGMLLVSLAIFIATPIVLTIGVPFTVSLEWLRDPNAMGWGQQSIINGVAVWTFSPTDELERPPRQWPAEEGPNLWSFAWERKGRAVRRLVPLWPAPLAVGTLGGVLWWKGRARKLAGSRQPRPTVRRIAASLVWPSVIGVGFILAGLTALSCVQPLWISTDFHAASGVWSRTFGLEASGAYWTDQLWYCDIATPLAKPGPLTASFDAGDQWLHITAPFWPVPLAIISLAAVGIVRSERTLHRRIHNRCTACGYSLAGIDGNCPECGRDTR